MSLWLKKNCQIYSGLKSSSQHILFFAKNIHFWFLQGQSITWTFLFFHWKKNVHTILDRIIMDYQKWKCQKSQKTQLFFSYKNRQNINRQSDQKWKFIPTFIHSFFAIHSYLVETFEIQKSYEFFHFLLIFLFRKKNDRWLLWWWSHGMKCINIRKPKDFHKKNDINRWWWGWWC